MRFVVPLAIASGVITPAMVVALAAFVFLILLALVVTIIVVRLIVITIIVVTIVVVITIIVTGLVIIATIVRVIAHVTIVLIRIVSDYGAIRFFDDDRRSGRGRFVTVRYGTRPTSTAWLF